MNKELLKRRLNALEVSVKALDARLGRVEKILDNNAEVHRDVTVMMGAELTIIRRVLEDMVRGETIMKGVGSIDFDHYLHKYNEQVEQELAAAAKKEADEEEQDTDEVFEFGGDHVKDERPRQEIA